jgi:hypothetical protein
VPKSIQVTLYDLFGYLLPGGVILLSLWIVFHSLFLRQEPLVLWAELSTQAIVGLSFVAYLLGHLGQGLGNLLQKLGPVNPDRRFSIPPEIDHLLRKAATSRFDISLAELTLPQLYELCDEALLHHGSLGEREIFTYREGFYRGTFVAFSLLALALLLPVAFGPTRVVHVGRSVDAGRLPFLFTSVMSALGACLALERYKRFARYRVRRCLLRFVALATSGPPPM